MFLSNQKPSRNVRFLALLVEGEKRKSGRDMTNGEGSL